jgi:NADPH:quinone reductase-like Zn-dependent oxidoreductase
MLSQDGAISRLRERVRKMKAVTQDRYGSENVLELRSIDKPVIKEHEVLIRVQAAGVNPGDWAIMNGLPFIARPTPLYGLGRPRNAVRGTDVAGVVEAVGSDVTRLRQGDAVFGLCHGSFAAFASASEDRLTLKPANVTFEQAAAVPTAGLVALQAVRDHGHVEAGQRVLINGASGAIGTLAVQIAKSFGADVTGVCSTQTMDLVLSIGADHAIDYSSEDFTRTGGHYDFILDNAGNHSLAELRRALTPTGTLVPNAGAFHNHWFAGGGRVVHARVLSRFVSQTLRPFLMSPKLEDLVFLKDLIEAGKITPVIDRAYTLSEVPEALGYVGRGHAHGKVVIDIDEQAAV